MLRELERELHYQNHAIARQEVEIEDLRVKCAKYKALHFHRWELGKKLQNQTEENMNNLVGEYDGFCYSSIRANAVFRTLERMLYDEIINKEEYEFCKII